MPDSFMRIDPADFKVWDQPDSKVLDPRGAAPTSAAGLGCSPLPHLHRDSARPFLHLHPGLGSPSVTLSSMGWMTRLSGRGLSWRGLVGEGLVGEA